jgi:predicted ATPase
VQGAALVGRDDELRTLTALLSRQGPARAALVLGEAGIGKTRLVRAAADEVENSGVTTVWGACLPLSESLPLLPVVDVIPGSCSARRR